MSTLTKKQETLGKILKAGLLPNLIGDKLDPVKVTAAAYTAGIRAMEVSCRRTDTIELIKRLKIGFPDMRFGVSSLVDDGPYFDFLQKRGPRFPSIQEAADAGADFLVSVLDFSPETYARHNDLPIVPACYTLNEAKKQLDLGANIIKFCGPSFMGGPAFFKGLINGLPVHKGIPILLTGGIVPNIVEEYVEAGMMVTVAGFDIILKGQYEQQQERFEVEGVVSAIRNYLETYAKARAKFFPDVDFDSADSVKIQEQSGKFMNV